MYSRWLEALNEVTRWREARFMELLNELCRKSLVVVLFGSRARGDNTPLSDWDLMAIIPTGEYRIEVRDIGQVVWLPLSRLREVLESSMVILDAVTDGKVLCGDSRVFDDVKDRVRRYIEERGLVRTKSGWFPKGIIK
ncbi:nucleotidyltransferase domain-containing protein [Vulcanisaeta distributa]|uniref:DNA polymerase beta domain protein region n=1 Tax=Vulcanisaeta distributa (strain DSM 14429 / JCM 11212 / NBRC 100878 / IC-017) TaxID=572478 RepID=E1QTG9_VULDI|nr:nucleotidyltransferase domain-containing protein [Vulcanisaeta distributa]ADN50962.1 DNA polymerase beta domain protein region [Vulcanisaeta distributa DSM 14429]